MRGSLYMPDGRLRSATAVPGKSDVRDDMIYSAVVLAHGGAGVQKSFTVPQGQAIPSLKGSTITLAQAHHTLFTEATTNVAQAGQLGAAIGDASVRSIGLRLEAAPVKQDGSVDTYGATQQELAEVTSKVYFQFKIAGKIQTQGPVPSFPANGGIFGSLAVTASGAARSLATNGALGVPKKLKLPILISRTDTIEGVVGVAGSAALVFRTTTGEGAASLLMVELQALVKGDVR